MRKKQQAGNIIPPPLLTKEGPAQGPASLVIHMAFMPGTRFLACRSLQKMHMKRSAPHVLLFTGHMPDRPGRAAPRFPPEHEAVARRAIQDAVRQEMRHADRPLLGIAGGASGGDMLFHEACATLGLPSETYLALPPAAFLEQSVAHAGPAWVRRFHRLVETRPVHILEGASPDDPLIWERANRWMLHQARTRSGGRLTLLALWNGQEGDGPGGTADLVQQARLLGHRTVVLDTNTLFKT